MEAEKVSLPMVLMARLRLAVEPGLWSLGLHQTVSGTPSRVAHTTDSQDALYSHLAYLW